MELEILIQSEVIRKTNTPCSFSNMDASFE